MRNIIVILLMAMLACVSCELQLKPNAEADGDDNVRIHRYDRIESLYLTTGDYAALQQLNLNYPQQTRMLIEDVLKLGRVNDREINTKWLGYYQDTTLQAIINDVELQYARVDDIEKQLNIALDRLEKCLPNIPVPVFYTQIGDLGQSIVVGDGAVGISLDKYLGNSYPLYLKYYTESQRKLMTRKMIVPDAMVFYLLSIYPIPGDEHSQLTCDIHIGKIQWVVNKIIGKKVFNTNFVRKVDHYVSSHKYKPLDLVLREERLP